jgi:hypothetical protein
MRTPAGPLSKAETLDLHTVTSGDANQLFNQRSHATLRHAPLSGAISDQVIQEATIGLHVIRRHERPDQCVSQNDASHQVVTESIANDFANWDLHQTAPHFGQFHLGF